VYQSVCYHVFDDYVVKKKPTTYFSHQQSYCWLTKTLRFGFISVLSKKPMKCNGADSRILAGAGQTLLVNMRRMKSDKCALQGQRKRLNN